MKVSRPEKRFYRESITRRGKISFEIVAGESDLWISLPERFGQAVEKVKAMLTEHLILLRSQVQSFIEKNPRFLNSLEPIDEEPTLSPAIIRKLLQASRLAGVGPMAGIAGAINLFIGERLLEMGVDEFIVENGGDVYVVSKSDTVVGMFTGNPELDRRVGILLPPGRFGVCSSSSRIGHSLSFGRTLIATAISEDPVLSDCGATALGNSTNFEEFDITYRAIDNLYGAIAVIGKEIAIAGNVEFVKLEER